MEDLARFLELIPKELQEQPIWTVSIENDAGEKKCVANIHSGGDTAETFTGFKRGTCTVTDYDTLAYVIEKCQRVGYEITNIRLGTPMLRAYCVIDVEKTASEETRSRFGNVFQTMYSETSMSGLGVHHLVKLVPSDPLYHDIVKYKIDGDMIYSVKDPDGEFEILCYQDVTLTGNGMCGEVEYTKESFDAWIGFYDTFGEMVKLHRKNRRKKSNICDWGEEPDSEAYKEIVESFCETDRVNSLTAVAKDIWDKHSDMSRALWRIAHVFYKMARDDVAFYTRHGAEFTVDDVAWITYKMLDRVVAPMRLDSKYDENRHGVPILLDEARRVADDYETNMKGDEDDE